MVGREKLENGAGTSPINRTAAHLVTGYKYAAVWEMCRALLLLGCYYLRPFSQMAPPALHLSLWFWEHPFPYPVHAFFVPPLNCTTVALQELVFYRDLSLSIELSNCSVLSRRGWIVSPEASCVVWSHRGATNGLCCGIPTILYVSGQFQNCSLTETHLQREIDRCKNLIGI